MHAQSTETVAITVSYMSYVSIIAWVQLQYGTPQKHRYAFCCVQLH